MQKLDGVLLDYVRRQQILRNNLFGDDKLAYLSFTDRFAYTRIDGKAVTGWMPPSRRYIYLIPENREFGDREGYLWIRDGALFLVSRDCQEL